MSLRIACLTLLSAGLVACATSKPYAEVTGEKIGRGDGFEEQVFVMGIDGSLTLSRSLSEIIDPGFRTILLATTRQDRRSKGSSTVVPLNAKPCLRYHFVARHESLSEVHPWQLVLKNVEPIPECVAKFPQHKPIPAPTPAPTPPAKTAA